MNEPIYCLSKSFHTYYLVSIRFYDFQDVHTTHENQLFSRNMAFYSTSVVRGTAKAVVTRTGINTVFGQMADLTASNPKDETLITKELSQFIHLVIFDKLYGFKGHFQRCFSSTVC